MKKEKNGLLTCLKRAPSKDEAPTWEKRKKFNIGGKIKLLLGKNEKCNWKKMFVDCDVTIA